MKTKFSYVLILFFALLAIPDGLQAAIMVTDISPCAAKPGETVRVELSGHIAGAAWVGFEGTSYFAPRIDNESSAVSFIVPDVPAGTYKIAVYYFVADDQTGAITHLVTEPAKGDLGSFTVLMGQARVNAVNPNPASVGSWVQLEGYNFAPSGNIAYFISSWEVASAQTLWFDGALWVRIPELQLGGLDQWYTVVLDNGYGIDIGRGVGMTISPAPLESVTPSAARPRTDIEVTGPGLQGKFSLFLINNADPEREFLWLRNFKAGSGKVTFILDSFDPGDYTLGEIKDGRVVGYLPLTILP